MERIKVRKEIKIERNVIERFLMYLKNFVRDNRKTVFSLFIGIMVAAVLLISGLIYFDKTSLSDQVKFEKIMTDYREYSTNNKKININKIINDLKGLADSTYFGFVHEMSFYVIGNIYFSEKQYKNAIEYLLKYVDIAPSSMFSAIALQKAAIAAEEINDLTAALKIYKQLEKDYSGSIIAEQIYFNLGRIYSKKNDILSSKRSYRRVISSFPNSLFAEKAKKRLFLIGLKKKRELNN